MSFAGSFSVGGGPSQRGRRTAVLYAFDLIEHDRTATLVRLLRDIKAVIVLNGHVAGDGSTYVRTLAGLVPRALSLRKVDGTYQSGLCRYWI